MAYLTKITGRFLILIALSFLAIFFLKFQIRSYGVDILGDKDKFRNKEGIILPASSFTSQLQECNLEEGLARGVHPLGYTFFTFDPRRDRFVSAGMISTRGLYDAHVHAALDISLKILKADFRKCGAILDVGSNLGTLALYAGAVAQGCPVHAFEIQPAVACRLEMSIQASGFSHVKLHRAAVSSISGKSYSFRALPSNPGGVGLQGEVHEDETGRNIVKTVKLDDLFQDEADIIFMKVDTEGHEFEVLKSAERLLKEHKIRNIVVEIRSQQAEMVEYMYANGYTCDLTKSAWRSKAKLSCKNSMEKVISEIQRIPKGHFDDMFCCVT